VRGKAGKGPQGKAMFVFGSDLQEERKITSCFSILLNSALRRGFARIFFEDSGKMTLRRKAQILTDGD
jgi:hypothetical protein